MGFRNLADSIFKKAYYEESTLIYKYNSVKTNHSPYYETGFHIVHMFYCKAHGKHMEICNVEQFSEGTMVRIRKGYAYKHIQMNIITKSHYLFSI